jgi:hypothetical protein
MRLSLRQSISKRQRDPGQLSQYVSHADDLVRTLRGVCKMIKLRAKDRNKNWVNAG